jgi:acyl-CoA thioester hydrolase
MNAERKPVHVELIPIRWRDMDALGHVNNMLYFGYMEDARNKWLGDMRPIFQAEGVDTVIANTSCNYRKPFVFPGTIEVKIFVTRIGHSSVTTEYEMRLEGEDTLYADGTSVVVWTNMATGKAARVPEVIRDHLAGHDTA